MLLPVQHPAAGASRQLECLSATLLDSPRQRVVICLVFLVLLHLAPYYLQDTLPELMCGRRGK